MKRNILLHPDPRLKKTATPVADLSDGLRRLADDMVETMYAAPGIGLAASQVNIHQRLLVVDVSDDKSEPMVFINPEIVEKEGQIQSDEGCLSIPKIREEVYRKEIIDRR